MKIKGEGEEGSGVQLSNSELQLTKEVLLNQTTVNSRR